MASKIIDSLRERASRARLGEESLNEIMWGLAGASGAAGVMYALSHGRTTPIGHGGGSHPPLSPDHWADRDPVRKASRDAYAKAHHKANFPGKKEVTAKTNRSTKSFDASTRHAYEVDIHFHRAKAELPNEMAAFPKETITRYAKKNKLSPEITAGMHDYEPHARSRDRFKRESLEEAGRFAQYLNTVAMAGRKYEPGQKVFVKGRKGVEFQFHRYDDDGNAIVVSGGKKYRFHPLNVTHFAEAKNEPTVLSGGNHNEEPEAKRSGKRDNITVFDGNSNATVRMKTKTEETDLGEGKALTVAQRLQRGRQIKRIKPKLKRGAKRALSQSPSASRIWKRSERAARNLLKKRFSPVKGVSYSKLSTTQKIFVDRTLEKRQKLIKKVAKRLLPKVRAASFKRLQSYRAGTGRSRLRENEAFEAQFNQRPLPQIIESMIIDMGDHPMADSLMTLLDLTAEKDSPAVRSLKEKAESINVPFAEVLQVYADALLEYKRSGSKLTGEQYAFNAVNVYVADRKAPTINEKFESMSEGFELIDENVSFKSHGDEKGGHHLLWKGKKRADLKLVSKGLTSGGHRYTLHKANGEPVKNVRGLVVSMTAKGWQKFLHPHFEKQDKLAAMKKEEWEVDGMVAHAATVVNTLGGPKSAADFMKRRAREKAKTLKNRLDKRHLHKEE